MGDGNVGRVVFGPSYGIGKTAKVALDILYAAEKERIEAAQKEADGNKCAECETKEEKIALLTRALEFYADLANYPVEEHTTGARPQDTSAAIVRNMEATQKMTLKARHVLAEVGKLADG